MEEYPSQQNIDSSSELGEKQSSFRYPLSVVIGVIVLSLLSLLLMFNQVSNRLVLQIPNFGSSQSSDISKSTLLEQEEEQLRTQDSDSDGLTDYQELKVYGSSPFISDTDSDGIPDAVEVANGTDPNCPEDQNCFAGVVEGSTQVTTANPQQEQINQIASDPDEIRKLLIESGIDPAIVNQTDDQSLQILAQEVLNKFNDPTEKIQTLIDGLNTSNVRDFFVSIGVSEEQVAEFSNEELLELSKAVLEEQLTTN